MEKEECYIVENISGKTIVLSDLRAEIKPGTSVDLAKVARRIDIERSYDLVAAIKAKLLKLVKRHTERVKVEKPISEAVLKRLVEEATQEAMRKAAEQHQPLDITKLKELVENQTALLNRKNDSSQISDKLDNLMNMMSNISTGQADKSSINSPQISESELAAIAQKGVANITSEIKSSGESKVKKIKLNTQASDLAKELE